MSLHKNITGSDVHTPITYTYANSTERLAAIGFTANDIGKLARQTDNNSVFMLSSYSPIVWTAIIDPTALSLAETLDVGNSAGTNQINMNSNRIVNLATPLSYQDAASKGYVDTLTESTSSVLITYTNVASANILNYVTSHLQDVQNVVIVQKDPSSGQFSSIVDAVASITDASSGNPYLVKVGPGVFVEDTIVMKSFVAIRGESSLSTVIQVNDPSKNVVVGADQTILSDVFLQGATNTGSAAIYFSNGQPAPWFLTEDISFGDNDILIRCVGTGSGNCLVLADNLHFGSPYLFTTGLLATNDGSGIGRIVVRNSTTVSGLAIPNPTFFAKANAPGCQIVLNAVQLRTGNPSPTGTAIYAENGGVLRLTAVNVNGWATAINMPNIGSATNITALAMNFENNTQDINVQHPSSTGKIEFPSDFSKINIIDSSGVYIIFKDPHIITVAKKGGDFASIKSAVDSITTATSSNLFQVSVGPGIFIEDTITLKPYVSLSGTGQANTFVQVDATNKNVIVGSALSSLSNLTLAGSTDVGKAAVYWANTNSDGDQFTIRNVGFDDTNILIHLEEGTNDAILDVSNIEYRDSVFDTAYLVKSTLGLVQTTLQVDSVRNSIENPFTVVVDVSGPNTYFYFTNINYVSYVGGKFLTCYNGGTVILNSVSAVGFDTGIESQNIGNSPTLILNGLYLNNTVNDLLVSHPGTLGNIIGSLDSNKVTIDSSSPIKVTVADLNQSSGAGNVILGDIFQATRYDRLLNFSKLTRETSAAGLISGGTLSVSPTGGNLNLSVLAGTGFLESSDNFLKEVSWNTNTITLAPSSYQYIVVNENSNIVTAANVGDNESVITLGYVVADNQSIRHIENSPIKATRMPNRLNQFNREAIGNIYTIGSTVTETATAQLSVTPGNRWFGTDNFLTNGGSPVVFNQLYRNSPSTFTESASSLFVNTTQYDSGAFTTLTALSSGYYAKHSLYVSGQAGDGTENYLFVFSQAQYSTLVIAEGADIPAPPNFFADAICLIATIITKQGNSHIVEIRDERPIVGFKASGISASSDHGNLTGLSNDDHHQYLLVNGSRAMIGALDMGANQIMNVGNVDGVDVSNHAARHLPNGLDAVVTAAPTSTLTGSTTASTGIANSLSRSDHTHAISLTKTDIGLPNVENISILSTSTAASANAYNQSVTYTNTASGNLVTYINSQINAHNELSEILAVGNSAGANQIDMNSNKIVNLLDPTGPADATSKGYVDTLVNTVSASQTLSVVLGHGNSAGTAQINMNFNKITNVLTPTLSGDATNKSYVDANDFWNRNSSTGTLTSRTSGDKLVLDTSTKTYPPLILTPNVLTPTTELSGGSLVVQNNQLYLYDLSRSKWLSTTTLQYSWGRSTNADGAALLFGGDVARTTVGPAMLFDATIVGITARTLTTGVAKQMDIYVNGVDIATPFTFNGGTPNTFSSNTTNINLNAGDYLSIFANANLAAIANTIATLFIKWRI